MGKYGVTKKLVAAFFTVGALVAAQCAAAADLSVAPLYKAPPPPQVSPAYNWTGFYLGVNGGGGALYNGATERSAAAAHCGATSAPTVKKAATSFLVTPYLPTLSALTQTRHIAIYEAGTVAALGYLWLTVGPHRKVPLACRVHD